MVAVLEGESVKLAYFTADRGGELRFGLLSGERVIDLAQSGGPASLAAALQMSAAEILAALRAAEDAPQVDMPLTSVVLKAPIDHQEVWAAGVTYLRSRDARMEESSQRDVYDRVYDADRPELFLKATPNRVSGPGEAIAIRGDSGWDVPEPELAILLNAHGELVGYTIGNDVSSRSIEGENPLYLPQAKVYSRCAALGPAVVTIDELPDVSNLEIQLTIRRGGTELFQDSTATSQLHRSLSDLTDYLLRDNEFPAGVFLMTGTGIVPPSEFTLQDGDEVTIRIDGIGSLVNPVVRLS
ncbi:MAG: Fumarylacetoacetate hydrolase family protein [Thermomicrobiales bacterium]|jgi:2-dehydro-3-deoxy-D-arabinonate dehydratase|nr:Fumarylacetoacetate hydrolase family protein [Thermomicrobiales bacterium]